MKFLLVVFLLYAHLTTGQSFVYNRNCIWKDSAILYRGITNELISKTDILFDSVSAGTGEVLSLSNLHEWFIYKTIFGKRSEYETLHFFNAGSEIGQQTFQVRNPGQDTLSWWKNTGTISHSQLLENKPFLLRNENGSTNFSRIIQFSCRYQKNNSELHFFSICDSTLNYDTNVNEWIQGEYNSFSGNTFPDCLLPFLKSLPIGTILYFDGFIAICPDCMARKLPFRFQIKIMD